MPQGLLAFSTWLPEQHSLWQCTTFTLLGVYLLWECICLSLRLRLRLRLLGLLRLLQQVLPCRLKAVVARLPRSLPVASRGAIRRVRMLLLLLGLVRGLVHGLVVLLGVRGRVGLVAWLALSSCLGSRGPRGQHGVGRVLHLDKGVVVGVAGLLGGALSRRLPLPA